MGELFAHTGDNYPFNKLTNINIDLNFTAEYDYLDNELWQNTTVVEV